MSGQVLHEFDHGFGSFVVEKGETSTLLRQVDGRRIDDEDLYGRGLDGRILLDEVVRLAAENEGLKELAKQQSRENSQLQAALAAAEDRARRGGMREMFNALLPRFASAGMQVCSDVSNTAHQLLAAAEGDLGTSASTQASGTEDS